MNADFKIITGIESERFKQIADHIIDEDQLVSATSSRIHHDINKIRDCIDSVGRMRGEAAVLDLDFQSFMSEKIPEKEGCM